MVPRRHTRRSQTIETANNTHTVHGENQPQLENPTNSDIVPNRRGRRRQTANTTQATANIQGASRI